MTWITYTVGALLATTAGALSLRRYLLGYLILFLIEAVTVLLNDWFDFETDQSTCNAGPFSGGSRVLIDGKLDRDAMRTGIGVLADAAVGKRTLVVILGAPGAIRLAIVAAAIAPIIALLIMLARPDMAWLRGWGAAGAALHAILLWQRLRLLANGPLPGRIDGTIVLALTYTLWFCSPPLIALMLA